MIGKIISYEVLNNQVKILFEQGVGIVTILDSKIINFFSPIYRTERNSKVVEIDKINFEDFKVQGDNTGIKIFTKDLFIEIFDNFKVDILDNMGNYICKDYRDQRKSFIRRGGNVSIAEAEGHVISKEEEYKVFVSKELNKDTCFYGLGERTGSLNKRGYHYKNWNTDDPKPHGETFEQLYKSIPFFITVEENNAYGIFFDNHFESHFDLGKENNKYYYFGAKDGNLDYYFIYGPKVKDVVKFYTELTGRTPLPQLWSLGYQQCRWAYSPEERLLEVAKLFREKGIPCDTLYLDIEYMDNYKVFTHHKERFPNFKETIAELKDMGFKVVTIIDPGVKVEKGYSIYDEGISKKFFATDKDGIVYKNWVWPGDSVFPDFMQDEAREWWGNNHKALLDMGVSGIWNDMNEPASFNGPLPEDVLFNENGKLIEHKEVHNIYGHMMCKATYKGVKDNTHKRPFVVTRACYAGTQKYSTVWTGDNQSTWEHLRMSIPMLINLGLSGLAFCGTDVGGFGFDCTPELLSRWVQVGAFTPLFRNHSTIGSRDQEPWAFDKQTEDINRKYIKLRYKLLPYIYDLFWKCEHDGSPIIRPVFYHYENDKNTYNLNDQFLVGENMLVAPIVEQGANRRLVYLPMGNNWINYWTKEFVAGGQYIIVDAPLDVCPIFIKAGSIIPTWIEQNYIGEKNIDTLDVNVYLDNVNNEFIYYHYDDDGESFNYKDGNYSLYKIKVKKDFTVTINITKIKDSLDSRYTKFKINIFNSDIDKILVNGNVVELDSNKSVEVKC